jgi:hypothetical protein
LSTGTHGVLINFISIQSGVTARCGREQVFWNEVRQALAEQSTILQRPKVAMSENVIEQIKGEVCPDFYPSHRRNCQETIEEP